MGWRDSYDTLLELFPQVDSRLIKGAALEHGSDVGAAAEFILNDVLSADEGTSDDGHRPDPTLHQCARSSLQAFEERSVTAGERQIASTIDFGTSVGDPQQDEQAVVSVGTSEVFGNSESHLGSGVLRSTSQPAVQELTGESSSESHDGLLTMAEMGKRVEPKRMDAPSGGSTELVEEDELGLSNIVRQIFLLSRRMKDSQASISDVSIPLTSAEHESVSINSSRIVEHSTESPSDPVDRKVIEDRSEVENSREKSQVCPCDPSASNTTLAVEVNLALSEDDGIGEADDIALAHDESFPAFSAEESGRCSDLEDRRDSESVFDQYSSQIQRLEEHFFGEDAGVLELMTLGPHEEYTTKKIAGEEDPVYDESFSAPRTAYGEDEGTLNDGLDSMMSIQKSAISEEMDRADWESVNCIAVIQMSQMEPLDNLVEEAKADKEALISSIEEIRVLRLMTDQAEYAARQAREEAARGGSEVMAKVNEMRKMLSRAREANAVHAGEVFGEKAVLATEARELQHRLAQVNTEKAKSVAALNEIKTSLQARIEIAVRERDAANEEKIEKELRAKEALAKEEILLAKVAQESRDLDAEAEDCRKIREFLIERGSIVDALQGEVAVLREDAESLRKDLESMSLSLSGFHANMSSQTSDVYSGIVSGSGKFSESYGQLSQAIVPVEGRALANSNSEPPFLPTASAVQKAVSDRKSGSSLPSLLRGLSGSQDLNGSSHSSHSSHGSNALSSSRSALDVNEGERSHIGSENSMTDIKYPSLPNSPTSPEEKKQEERELLKAKMAMFPGEELEMEYLGVHNLDVFRSDKPIGSGGDTDEEGWQMLETVISRSSSRSSEDK